MINNIGYAPIISDVVPAFDNTCIKIPFTHNPAVGQNDYLAMRVYVNEYSGGSILEGYVVQAIDNYIILEKTEEYPGLLEECVAGQWYKIQIAYKFSEDKTGPLSNVAISTCIGEPFKPEIINLSAPSTKAQSDPGIYKGSSSQNGVEPFYSYQFIFKAADGSIIQDSGEQLFFNNTTPIFELAKELEEGKNYSITYRITTINGYQSEIEYAIVKNTSADTLKHELVVGQSDLDENGINKSLENAYVVLQIKPKKNIEGTHPTYIIERNSGEQWDKLFQVACGNNILEYKDCTLKQGIAYQYAIRELKINKDSKEYYTPREILENPVVIDFEDIFLSDGERQLKIKFNPKVSSLKDTILESKIETIGSKYPFFFRNGSVRYKEIPISGLLSYLADEHEMFITRSELGVEGGLSINQTPNNISAEREFRDKVYAWLTDGRPKLFRSPTEGNYIVRIMNVSMSPNETLGRMLYSFSATGFEIAEADVQYYIKERFYRGEIKSLSALGYFILGLSPLGGINTGGQE